MLEKINDNIYIIKIPLPNNPLRELNSYVILGKGGRNLIVDTGFNLQECRTALFSGLAELKLNLTNTDVFLTHLHSDHSGNANILAASGCGLYIGETDYNILFPPSGRGKENPPLKARYLSEGFPDDVLNRSFDENPARKYAPLKFEAQTLSDGDMLEYGDMKLQCILTPGHTPGHLCLYDSASKTMFLGDHVLFDITPNITCWNNVEDSLGTYLESLKKIKRYDVEVPLPAHRTAGSCTMTERVDKLLEHHSRRLSETLDIVRRSSGLTAYQIAGIMPWKIRAASWEEFPLSQKMFAVGEALSHLDYLQRRGLLTRDEGTDGKRHYYCVDN